MSKESFIDFYEMMQISPKAEPETLQRVYRMLASRYHPDNPETGDTERFVLLNRAYQILMEPEARTAYDVTYHLHRLEPLNVFNLKEFAVGIDGEGNRRMGILSLLYNRRRTNPEAPGMSLLEFETLMSFPREHLVFTLWYLKEKKLLRQGEESDFIISADGVDYVDSHLPSNQILYKMLKAAESGTAHVVTVDRDSD